MPSQGGALSGSLIFLSKKGGPFPIPPLTCNILIKRLIHIRHTAATM